MAAVEQKYLIGGKGAPHLDALWLTCSPDRWGRGDLSDVTAFLFNPEQIGIHGALMSIALITGAAGLVGAEAARLFAAHGLDVVGVDNDMRQCFFDADASTAWSRWQLQRDLRNYRHHDVDIRDNEAINAIFARHGILSLLSSILRLSLRKDWAARAPEVDFSINAGGTLKLLEAVRRHCPDASFIFISTNKLYGDATNHLPLVENETCWELAGDHQQSG